MTNATLFIGFPLSRGRIVRTRAAVLAQVAAPDLGPELHRRPPVSSAPSSVAAVDAALEGVLPALGGRRYGRFTVIDGGRE
jgi:hypothetical protein